MRKTLSRFLPVLLLVVTLSVAGAATLRSLTNAPVAHASSCQPNQSVWAVAGTNTPNTTTFSPPVASVASVTVQMMGLYDGVTGVYCNKLKAAMQLTADSTGFTNESFTLQACYNGDFYLCSTGLYASNTVSVTLSANNTSPWIYTASATDLSCNSNPRFANEVFMGTGSTYMAPDNGSFCGN